MVSTQAQYMIHKVLFNVTLFYPNCWISMLCKRRSVSLSGPTLRGIQINCGRRSKRNSVSNESFAKRTLRLINNISYSAISVLQNMLEDAKRGHHRSKFATCEDRNLFRLVNSMCKAENRSVLPSRQSEIDLANRFASYFHDKISVIHENLDSTPSTQLSFTTQDCCSVLFNTLSEVSNETVLNVIMDSPTKSNSLDPIPA